VSDFTILDKNFKLHFFIIAFEYVFNNVHPTNYYFLA